MCVKTLITLNTLELTHTVTHSGDLIEPTGSLIEPLRAMSAKLMNEKIRNRNKPEEVFEFDREE